MNFHCSGRILNANERIKHLTVLPLNMLSVFFSLTQGNRLDKDISWTHERSNKKELHSFMTSGNNNQLIQCHMSNKTESLEKSCENFNFSKRPRGLQEQKYVFRECIYFRRQEFPPYVKNQVKLKSSYKSLDSVLCYLTGCCCGNKPTVKKDEVHPCTGTEAL